MWSRWQAAVVWCLAPLLAQMITADDTEVRRLTARGRRLMQYNDYGGNSGIVNSAVSQ